MHCTLMQHQKDAVSFVVANKGIAALHHEPGCGKTLAALATYDALKQVESNLKLLVICPISLIHGAWVKEIEHFTDFTWYDLHSGMCVYGDRGGPDICIINFEALISITKFN